MSVERAIAEGDYAALLKALQSAPSWTETVAIAVHHALVAWCERTLSLPVSQSKANAAALYDLIGRLRAIHGDAALDAITSGMSSQWRGFELLLDERIAKVNDGAEQRKAVMQRKHVRSILDHLIRSGSATLDTLRSALGVSASTLSQVLGTMEAAQLIERERGGDDGRIRTVRLTEVARVELGTQLAQTDREEHQGLKDSGWLEVQQVVSVLGTIALRT
jgi:DNA-binding MarR family transcriptional regulator